MSDQSGPPLPEPAAFSAGTRDGAPFSLKRSTCENFAIGALQPLCEWYRADQVRAAYEAGRLASMKPSGDTKEGGATGLRWHYGPTDKDQDYGKMWCADCGDQVFAIEDGLVCTGCGKQVDRFLTEVMQHPKSTHDVPEAPSASDIS